jgi:hypothetical protein
MSDIWTIEQDPTSILGVCLAYDEDGTIALAFDDAGTIALDYEDQFTCEI